MKKYLLILLSSFFLTTFVKAQQDNGGKKAEKIEALKIAFITEKLELTADEAQRFWPVYNSYETELKQLIRDNKGGDIVEGDEKILNLRKRYKAEFIRVIGQPKMNRLFMAEREFRGALIRHLNNNKLQRPLRNR